MPEVPEMASAREQGLRQQRAAKLKAQTEARQREAGSSAATMETTAADATAPSEGPPAVAQARGGSQDEPAGAGTVGYGDYLVKQGDCVSSIAKEVGHFWERIWNYPDNTELREVREDPNVLLPGDRVAIPPLEAKQEPGQTEMRHRFVRRGEPCWLRLRLTEGGDPRANQSYTLVVDGQERSGVTDAAGKLNEPVPGNARLAILRIGDDEYRLKLGCLDPITELRGVQERLNNLGFECGPVDGILGPRTLAALNQFRMKRGLAPSSQVDDAVRRALEAEHDEMRENVPKARDEPDRDEPDPMAGDFPSEPESESDGDSYDG